MSSTRKIYTRNKIDIKTHNTIPDIGKERKWNLYSAYRQ